MPGIDFNRLRAEVTMEHVLSLLGFEPVHRRADQWYGPCPLHKSTGQRQRSFSVNIASGCYYRHKCRSHGNQLRLWAEATQMELHASAIQHCQQLNRDVPWLERL
jgi:hypothetical protein